MWWPFKRWTTHDAEHKWIGICFERIQARLDALESQVSALDNQERRHLQQELAKTLHELTTLGQVLFARPWRPSDKHPNVESAVRRHSQLETRLRELSALLELDNDQLRDALGNADTRITAMKAENHGD